MGHSRKSYNNIVKAVTFHYRCRHDGQTVVYLNGVSQEARFSFEAFQFVEHQNKTIFSTFSTFYLHCVTRLCENSTCPSMLPVTILPQCSIPVAVFHRLRSFCVTSYLHSLNWDSGGTVVMSGLVNG